MGMVRSSLKRNDFLLAGILMLLFFTLGIWNLGSLHTPVTGWTSKGGESFYLDLGRVQQVDTIYFFDVSPRLGYQVYFGRPGDWRFELNATRENYVFSWIKFTVRDRTRYVRFVPQPGVEVNEIILYSGSERLKPVGIFCETGNCETGGRRLSRLIDEQEQESPPGGFSGSIFDEIYFARTAYEHLNRKPPFEWTHPPLGKLLIALGIIAFKPTAFGWRIVPLLFGTLMIGVIYFLALRIFNNRRAALTSGFLLSVEGMHFVLSRIAMVDTILVAFILLMLYFFYDFYDSRYSEFKPKSLVLAALFFGLAVSTKWSGVFAGAAILLLLVFKERGTPRWFQRKRPLAQDPLLVFIASFGILGFIVYYLSYTPIMGVPGEGSGLSMVLRYQGNMFNYHAHLNATHPFASPWYSWILMFDPFNKNVHVPVWIYGGRTFNGLVSDIVILGNPLIFWGSIPALGYTAWRGLKNRDKKTVFILTLFLVQLLPYLFIGRITFLYHLFPNVPIMILALTFALEDMWERYPWLAAVYLLAAGLAFAYFYPILSGYPITQHVKEGYQWFESWAF